MKTLSSRAASLLLALFLTPVGVAFAGDANVTADAASNGADGIFGLDANQGSGTQTNADDWYELDNALAGSGAQNTDTEGNANTGSGTQNNAFTTQQRWKDMDYANTGTGAQVLSSDNSNGGERLSDDVVIDMGDTTRLATADLEAAVSGNSVTVAGPDGGADAQLEISGDSQFHGLAGVNAIALGSGGNASQNVSVNVSAAIDAF